MRIERLPLDDLLRRLEQGATVLTVNKRLARYLRQAYDARQTERALSVWPSPAVQAFGAWQRQMAGRLLPGLRMLEPDQALQLWERAIEAETAEGRGLLRVPDAAREAAKAHALLCEYETGFRPEEGGEDQRIFLRWQRRWADMCKGGGWDDPAKLPAHLAGALRTTDISLPTELWLAGFDDLTPAVGMIGRALETKGVRVRRWLPPACAASAGGLAVYADPEEEVRSCARWARRLLEEGSGRIGIVAFDMDAYRARLQRIFREELSPGALLPGAAEGAGFNLSLGTRLFDEGMVVAAFAWLSLGRTVNLDTLSFLLRSPFVWGHLSEHDARAVFDRELRNLRLPELPLRRVVQLARRGFKKKLGRCDILARHLETAQVVLEDSKARLPGAWARHFAGLLEACQWPGDRTLDSRDYQVFTSFKELLAGLARLDTVAEPMSRAAALALLRRVSAEQVFQPEGSQGRVQVLGVLEAAGMQFDALWLLGGHEEALPSPARPNPFIPPALQSRLGMPHADPARELDFAQKVAERLLDSTADLVASWPATMDGRDRQPSPLLRHLPTARPLLADSRQPALLVHKAAAPMEFLCDDRGPGIPADGKISGGTAILKDQALCPFRAYARHRLGALGLACAGVGLDGLDRGSLVHRVLELCWRELGHWHGLTELGAERLDALILEQAEVALDEYEKERHVPLSGSQRRLEKERLALLLREWFAVEALRRPFQIESLETWHRENFDRLVLQTRIDRVDRLADGTRVLLDYKTGRAGIGDWLGERPVEPQLPLYTLGRGPGDLAAVAFATVRRSECGFVGLGRGGDLLPGVAEVPGQRLLEAAGVDSWETLLDRWRCTLEKLGAAFADGHAVVDPVNQRQACERCDLHPLCRIGDSPSGAEEGELP